MARRDERRFKEDIAPTALTLAAAARIIRESVKDKSYRATPVGLLVGRYVRWFRNEWGATATTIRDYEAVLARMALTLADKDPLEVTADDLREVIDLWADREARTRAKVYVRHSRLLGLDRRTRSGSILTRCEAAAAPGST